MKKVYIIFISLVALIATGCKKEGKERFKINDKLNVVSSLKTMKGLPPYTCTAIYSHPYKDVDAAYTVISKDGLTTLNIYDYMLTYY